MGLTGLMWWIDRWRKSTAYMDMTLEEQGAYRNLLDEACLRGGPLPDDERILARASGDATAWKRVRGAVLAHFTLSSEGYRHETLDEVIGQSQRRIDKQKAYYDRKKSHEPGHDGGNKHGNKHGNKAGNKASNKHGHDGGNNATGNAVIKPVTRILDLDQDVRTSTGAVRRHTPKPVEISNPSSQDATPGTFGLYCTLAREARQQSSDVDGSDQIGNIAEWCKTLCAQRSIQYDGEIVTKAIEAVMKADERAAARPMRRTASRG